MPTARKTSLLALSSRTHCRTVQRSHSNPENPVIPDIHTAWAMLNILSWPAERRQILTTTSSLNPCQEQEEDERTLYL